MGADTSLPLPQVKPEFSTMCVSFQYADRVTVLHLDDAGLSIIRQAINETWKAGISKERSRCGSGLSFKLCGDPFGPLANSEESQQARQMVCEILQKLYESGWKIIVSSDLGRLENKSTLFFKRCPPEFSTLPFLCVGLSSSNKLQIVNLPSQLVEPIKETIRSSWILGIEYQTSIRGLLEVELRGNPWSATEQQSIMAKVLLQNIIATLRRYQWVYYCNVNYRNTTDSLFFRHDPNIPPGQSVPFCTISLNRHDRLRVINAPATIVHMIRRVVETTWFRGSIQAERDYHGSWEFTLSGTLWHSTKVQSIMARYLVLKILEAMLEQGWHNIAGINICRRDTDKSVLIFQGGEPQRRPMVCLSLNDSDKFWLINIPAQLVELFREILLSRWPKDIQEKELTVTCGCVHQIKLSGVPWFAEDSNDTIHARSFLCNIIQEFSERGWKLFLSADVLDSPLHSMWFVDDSACNGQPSAPSYDFSSASAPAQHDIGMPSLPYPPPAGFQMPEFGMQPSLCPQPSEAPPSYSQAIGWDSHAELPK